MPLSAITARATRDDAADWCAVTQRDLLIQRRLALKAVARGRNTQAATALAARIDAELAERRERIFDRRGKAMD